MPEKNQTSWEYMIYDPYVKEDDNTINDYPLSVSLFFISFLFLFIISVYCAIAGYVEHWDDYIVWILFFLVPACGCLYGTVGILYNFRQYQLTEDGIRIKWGLRKGFIPWSDILCYGIIPAAPDTMRYRDLDYRWVIVAFMELYPPRYPVNFHENPLLLGKHSRIEILFSDKRMDEFQRFAGKHNVTFIGKEGNGKRTEYSSWFGNKKRLYEEMMTELPEKRLARGIDIPQNDKKYVFIVRCLMFGLWIFVGFCIYSLIIAFIEDYNEIVKPISFTAGIFAGLIVLGYLRDKTVVYELCEDGLILKEGWSRSLICWNEIKYCGPILWQIHHPDSVVEGCILLSRIDKMAPLLPVDKPAGYSLNSRDSIIIRSTYVRVEEFRKIAEKHSIPWVEFYDENGKPNLPDGTRLNDRTPYGRGRNKEFEHYK